MNFTEDQLKNWGVIQRKKYRLGILSQSRIKKLESISDWVWEFPDTAAENKKALLDLALRGEPRPRQRKNPLGKRLTSYLQKSSECYDAEFDLQIHKVAPHWFINTAKENKNKLIRLAKAGDPRPSKKGNVLGCRLCDYTIQASKSYDETFDAEIRKLAPEWFADTAAENKKILLEMARSGQHKPNPRTHLYNVLSSYMHVGTKTYDSEFRKHMISVAPHWFANPADKKKEELLKMATSGEPKPSPNHPLYANLGSYINEKADCYDEIFLAQLKKTAPHWFADTVVENKKKIIEMAINGEPKPTEGNPLGYVFGSYVRESHKSFDPDFKEKIEKARPDWFITQVVTSAENKRSLLEIARRGERRPRQKIDPLGSALTTYTANNSGSYDKEFDRQIRKLAPHWWPAEQKKEELLRMARKGEPKPLYKKHKLAVALGHYVRELSNCYDPVFVEQLKKIAPHWTENTADENRSKLIEMAANGMERPKQRVPLGTALSNYIKYDLEFYKQICELAPQWFGGKAA